MMKHDDSITSEAADSLILIWSVGKYDTIIDVR